MNDPRSSPTPPRRRGFSLIEMMVALGIMSIVMIGAFEIFTEGMAFFRVSQAAANAQTSVTKSLGLIASEISNAAPLVTKEYPAAGPNLPGIVFATPLQEGGSVRYDPVNGDVFWQRYICFYFEADPTGGTNRKIWRVTEDVDSATEVLGAPGNRDTAYVASYLAGHPTNYFQTAPGTKRRLIADGISGMDVTIYAGGFGGTAMTRAYDLTVKAGDENNTTRDSYYIEVSTRMVPRG